MLKKNLYFVWVLVCLVAVFGTLKSSGQSNLWIYTDHLVNGFQDWSWAARNLTNTSPVHSGSNSISVTASQYTGISFHYQNDFSSAQDINTALYTNLTFWANGGSNGGQILQAYLTLDTTDQPGFTLPALTANTWTQYTVPLASLNAANKTNLSRITLKIAGSLTTTFYLDDIQLAAATPPALAHIGIDAGQVLRAADARWFGVNTATWDDLLNDSQTLPLVRESGVQTLRWPGGSSADQYHWTNDLTGNGYFMNLATNIGAQAFITVNYGSGTTNEAANWVKYFNYTNHCGFKYWEIGNEIYGTWETDNHTVPHDPYTYATQAKNFISAMKAADPSNYVKIGCVVVPGETSSINNSNHFAVNPRTGTTNYGWTPVMLNTLSNLGVVPDFLIYHFYPQSSGSTFEPNSPDSDNLLLQTSVNWAFDAANLRQQITDYLGPAGAGIELVCTENNSDAGSMGRQSTSIINALYLADSCAQLMKTEFNSYIWWDLHNGTDTQGDFDGTLYGWRTNGDFGLLSSSNTRYPIFYAEKMLQYFVRPGDTILNATTDSGYLAAYAARKADGAVALLVINKANTNILNAQISLTNFVPAPVATVRKYGLPQNVAAQVGNPNLAYQDIYTNTSAAASLFTNSFAPYSLTLLTLPPTPAQLGITMISPSQTVIQIQGQPGASYVLQSSTNFGGNWVSISTNLLAGSTASLTNSISGTVPANYFRSVWQP